MTRPALRIIRAEHLALSAVLTSLSMLLAEYRHRASPPDFGLLRAMLFYVDEFPERLHHTKESELLFPALRARSLEAADILDRLDREHASGEKAIRDLEHELIAFEVLGGGRGTNFEPSINRYVELYLAHMALEETEVLPLAERVLNVDDWLEIDAAFLKNRDPLTGYEPDDIYRPLLKRIAMVVPAPIGLGPAIE